MPEIMWNQCRSRVVVYRSCFHRKGCCVQPVDIGRHPFEGVEPGIGARKILWCLSEAGIMPVGWKYPAFTWGCISNHNLCIILAWQNTKEWACFVALIFCNFTQLRQWTVALSLFFKKNSLVARLVQTNHKDTFSLCVVVFCKWMFSGFQSTPTEREGVLEGFLGWCVECKCNFAVIWLFLSCWITWSRNAQSQRTDISLSQHSRWLISLAEIQRGVHVHSTI